jgi:hypothetical protein
MVNELHKPVSFSWRLEPSARPGSARAALVESLLRLREQVLERLDLLETMARERSTIGPAAGERMAQERVLERKRADIDEAERRLRTQAELQAREWTASLSQLEADRHLLAEAWEQIERERIASASAADHRHHALAHAQGQGLSSAVPPTFPHAGPLVATSPAAADSDPNDPVAHAILRQFQTLGSDVRRNAAEHW